MIQKRNGFLLLIIITFVVLAFTANCAVAFVAPQIVNSSGHHVVALQASSSTSSFNNNSVSKTRRTFLHNFLLTTTAIIIASPSTTQIAHALDYDAFEKGIITNDTAKCDPKRDPKCIPKLTSDEALCQYGGGGNARGEACKRVRAEGGVLPTVKKEKSLGGAYAM
jgi:hypothetical protein